MVAASSSTSKRAATSAIGWELVQQVGAERVDGLPLHAARRLQGVGKQPPRNRALGLKSGVLPVASLILSSSAASSSVVHSASVSNTRVAMLAAAALVKVMQRIFPGSSPRSSR